MIIPNYRVFSVPAPSTVELSDLSVADGRVTNEGGAIQNLGDLTLRRVSLHDNKVITTTDGYGGAGLKPDGRTPRVLNSALYDNSVTSSNTNAFFASGGAILNNGELIVRKNSTLTRNSAAGANNAATPIWSQDRHGRDHQLDDHKQQRRHRRNLFGPREPSAWPRRSSPTPPSASTAKAPPPTPRSATTSQTRPAAALPPAPPYDQVAEPLLGALALNGGPTQTMAPALTSPAIDAGLAGPHHRPARLRPHRGSDSRSQRPRCDATDIGALEPRRHRRRRDHRAPDNCPAASNPGQTDADADGHGDACDPDRDNDGAPDATDNCTRASNPDQADTDADGSGDACDPLEDTDADDDGVRDSADNCNRTSNPTQTDTDNDGSGDACDPAAAAKGCVVPDVKRGSKLAEVKSALEGAGCTLGKVTRKFSSKVKRGRLIELKAKAGTALPAGAGVDVVLSKGPKPS